MVDFEYLLTETYAVDDSLLDTLDDLLDAYDWEFYWGVRSNKREACLKFVAWALMDDDMESNPIEGVTA